MEILKNSLWNITALSFTLIVNFITIPFVIKSIGLSEFGNAGLFIALGSPLLIIGTVIGQSAIRIMSSKLALGDKLGAKSASVAAFYLCILLSLIGAVVFVTFFPVIFHSISSSSFDSQEFYIIAIAIYAQQLVIVFQSISIAHQNFKMIAAFTAGSAVITVVAIFSMVFWYPTAVGYLYGVALGFIGTMFLWWYGVIKLYGSLRYHCKTEAHGELLRFGYWQFISQFAGSVANQIDRYVLASHSSIAILGQFNVANRLQEAVFICAIKATEVLFPYFGSISQSDIRQQANFYLSISWVAMTFYATVMVPLIALSEPILYFWVGEEVANGCSVLLCTLVIGGLIGAGTNVYANFAMGTGRNRSLTWLTLMYSLLVIIITVTAISYFGPYAAGVGIVIASIVRIGLTFFILCKDSFKFVTASQLISSNLMPLLVGLLVAGTWWSFSDIQITNWFFLILTYILISFLTCTSIVLTSLLTRFGRDLFQQVINQRQNIMGLKQL